jgi:hypothetical protein
MHTDLAEFNKLPLDSDSKRAFVPHNLSEAVISQFAPAVHDTCNRLGLRAGWMKPENVKRWDEFPTQAKAKETVEELKAQLKRKDLSSKDRQKLMDDIFKISDAAFKRESNFAAARRIPIVIAVAGLRLETGQPTLEEERIERIRPNQ